MLLLLHIFLGGEGLTEKVPALDGLTSIFVNITPNTNCTDLFSNALMTLVFCIYILARGGGDDWPGFGTRRADRYFRKCYCRYYLNAKCMLYEYA